jgi:hypothetical protein
MIVLGAATIDLVAVATTDPVLKCRIWTAKHRIARAVVNRANASKTFNAAVAIDLVAAEDSVAIDLVAEASAVVAAVAGSEGVGSNKVLKEAPIFL